MNLHGWTEGKSLIQLQHQVLWANSPEWGVCSKSEPLNVSVSFPFYSMELRISLKGPGTFWWLVKNWWGATTHTVFTEITTFTA